MADPHRRLWQFRLRSLFLFTIPLSALTFWFFATYLQARAEKDAVAWVKQQNGFCVYDYENSESVESDGTLKKPFLANWLGIEFVSDVRSVVLDNTWITDLSPLLGLKKLNSLAIYIDVLPETDLSILKNFHHLKSISFKSTNLTSHQIQQIESLKGSLPNCKVHIDSSVNVIDY